MAQKKSNPKSKKPTNNRKHSANDIINAKFSNPKSENQILWNEEIDRLLRFENTYQGVKVNLPKKPKRVTKQAINDIPTGKDILKISTVTVNKNDDVRGVKKGTYNAAEYYQHLLGDRPLSSGKKYFKSNLRYDTEQEIEENEKSVTREEKETDVTTQEKKIEEFFAPVTETEQVFMEFEKAAEQFRPEFAELVKKWENSMRELVGDEQTAELLKENAADFGQISRKEAYSKKALIDWERKFVERLPQNSDMREQAEELLTELESDTDISDQYDEIQEYVYNSRANHRKNRKSNYWNR